MGYIVDYSKLPKPNRDLGIVERGYKKLEYTDYFYQWCIDNSKFFPTMNNLAHVWGLKMDTVQKKMQEKGIVLQFAESPLYQNRDWCIDQFIIQHKTVREVAKETGYKWRVLQKWTQEIYKLDIQDQHRKLIPTERQLSLIYGGILGDGCISTEGQYYIGHCEKQKEYLEWQRKELDSLCTGTYEVGHRIKEGYKPIFNKLRHHQNFYQFSTRKLDALKEIRLSKRQIEIAIEKLDCLGLSIYILDDGSCSKSGRWSLCCGILNETQCELLLLRINELTRTNPKIKWRENPLRGYYEMRFSAHDSRIISKMIKNNIPNDLDIVKYKLRHYNSHEGE